MYLQGEPLFPFGHGLSYSSFKYSNLRIDKSQLRSGGVIQALIDITNTGKHDGSDVVQLYTRVLQSKVTRPKHELKGFKRVSLKAGETKKISIEVLVDRLAYFDEKKNRFIVEAGDYELQIGSSSKEIQLREQMTIHENLNAQLEALPN
jgi:beta-glucosidase